MKICPQCNAQLDDSAQVCSTCGAQFAPVQQAPVVAPAPVAAPSGASKGLAITGMILGICGLVFAFFGYVGIICAVVGLILSIVAMSKMPKGAPGRGMAVAGLVLTIIGVAFSAIVLISCSAVLCAAESAVDNALGADLEDLADLASSLQ